MQSVLRTIPSVSFAELELQSVWKYKTTSYGGKTYSNLSALISLLWFLKSMKVSYERDVLCKKWKKWLNGIQWFKRELTTLETLIGNVEKTKVCLLSLDQNSWYITQSPSEIVWSLHCVVYQKIVFGLHEIHIYFWQFIQNCMKYFN